MANLLEQIGRGLRGAGAVMSAPVYDSQNRERMEFQQLKERREEMLMQQVQRAVESGALAPEKAQELAQKRGWKDFGVGGPSIATQKTQQDMQREESLQQYRSQARQKAFGKPAVVPQQVDESGAVIGPDGTGTLPDVNVDMPAPITERQMAYADSLIESGEPELVKEGTELRKAITEKESKKSPLGVLIAEREEIAARYGKDHPIVKQYDDRIRKETSDSSGRNIQFEEFATGKQSGGKPEFQKFRVMPDGTLKKEGEPFTKGALVDVNMPASTEYGKKFGGGIGERDIVKMDEAVAAGESVEKIDSLITHLEESDAITGLGAEFFKNAKRVQTLLLADQKSGKTVSDTELLNAFLGSDVFPMIKALGIGARGLDTPAEREFLREVMSGTIQMNKETLVKLAKLRRNVAVRAAEKWNERLKTIPQEALDGAGMTREPIKIPQLKEKLKGSVYGSSREIEDAYKSGKIKSKKELTDAYEKFYLENPGAE